jgi:hypothetical protein
MLKFIKIVHTLQIVYGAIFINFYNFKDTQILVIFHEFRVILYIPNNILKYLLILTIALIINILIHTTIL